MVQEATVVVIDNSEWMRNGDFSPSRFEAQNDAVNLICGTKTRQNAENTVGLISSAGRAVEVCATLNTDPAKILGALHKVKIAGESDFLGAIQVAALALRHRQNKRQEQRIVVFVGSPIKDSVEQLKKVGATLRKNKLAVDIVNFGEENADGNAEKLQAFHNAVNNRDNSYLITIPPGTSQLVEALVATPIIRTQGGDEGAAAPGTMEGIEFGVDPNTDPELLMALRLSMETAQAEERARQPGQPEGDAEMRDAQPNQAPSQNQHSEIDPELAQALAMSTDDMDMDPEIAAALQLSLQTAEEDNTKVKENEPTDKTVDMSDLTSDSIASVLLGLPGVDSTDPSVQALLQGMKKDEKEEKDEKEKDDK